MASFQKQEAFTISKSDPKEDKELDQKPLHSPLRPIVNWLIFFKIFGGFPLQLGDKNGVVVSNSKYLSITLKAEDRCYIFFNY